MIRSLMCLAALLAVAAGTQHALASGNLGDCRGTAHFQEGPGGVLIPVEHACFGQCYVPIGSDCELAFSDPVGGQQKGLCACLLSPTDGQVDGGVEGNIPGLTLAWTPWCDALSTWDVTQSPPVLLNIVCTGTCNHPGAPGSSGHGPCQSNISFNEGGHMLFDCWCGGGS